MNLSLIGLQWGDEGKGKIIDFLSLFFNIIIRYNGGHNAGHVIYKNNKKKIAKILPSGVFKKYSICFLSNKVFLLIENFLKEIYFNNKNIFVSENIFVINLIDEIIDYLLDKIFSIGTTNSGINIINLRKILKCCFNIIDIFKINFVKKIKKNLFFYNLIFVFFKIKIKISVFNFLKKNIINVYIIRKKIVHNIFFINNKINKFFESSQGVMLDENNGTYPYITNSNINNKSIYINSNFYLKKIKFIGVLKSYSTRIGNGYFNTKFFKKKNLFFSYINNEFGTNSNRIRYSGWIDINVLINNLKINNISNLILTKMDSLVYIKYIKLLINYKINKKYFNYKNYFKNNYFFFKSWKKIYKKYYKNEKNFHLFIRFIEKVTNTSIIIISIGKNERDILFL